MGENGTLLVVDDEPEPTDILAEYFVGQGYAVRAAGNASEARKQFDGGAPDLAILDIRMPGED